MLAVTCLVLPASTAVAAASAQEAIVVSPVTVARTLGAGEIAHIDIKVQNQTSRAYRFASGFLDVASANDESGDQRFSEPGTVERGAASWMSTDARRYELLPGGEQLVPVRIQVPAGAAPGGHYGTLVVQALPVRPTGSAITLQANVQVLFLLTVDGKVRHDLRIAIEPRARILLHPAGTWDVVLRNRGNVHANIGGDVRVGAMLGRTRSARMLPAIVLPGATRRIPVRVNLRATPNVLRGYMRAVVDGRSQQVAPSPKTVLLPIWALVGLVLAAALLVVRILVRRRGGRAIEEDALGESAEFDQ